MLTVAAAQQGGSNLTLYVAILGIIGTLTAALVTQWWSSRRDDKQWERQKQLQDERFDREREREEARWERERQQEEARWERERQERQAQWEREDSARLHQDRLQTYASLLTVSQDIATHVSYLTTFASALEKNPNDKNVARVEKCAEYIENRLGDLSDIAKSIRLIGSARVNDLTRELSDSTFLATLARTRDVGGSSIYEQISKYGIDVGKAASDLHREIRRDVGSGAISDDFDEASPF